VDALAKRYGKLPTEILRLTPFEFYLNVAIASRQNNTESEYEKRVKALLMEKEEAERKRAEIKHARS